MHRESVPNRSLEPLLTGYTKTSEKSAVTRSLFGPSNTSRNLLGDPLTRKRSLVRFQYRPPRQHQLPQRVSGLRPVTRPHVRANQHPYVHPFAHGAASRGLILASWLAFPGWSVMSPIHLGTKTSSNM